MNNPSTSNGPESFGKAVYGMSRHRKNKVLIWQSRKLEGRVYEFTLATKFRIPGLFSWRCLHCSLIRGGLKKKGMLCADKKIPLVLVENDVIKEDPDRPNNAPHFCEGRDVVESTVNRAKLCYYAAYHDAALTTSSTSPKKMVEEYAEATISAAPFKLTNKEKSRVQQAIDDDVSTRRVERGMQNQKRRLLKSSSDAEQAEPKIKLVRLKNDRLSAYRRSTVKYEVFHPKRKENDVISGERRETQREEGEKGAESGKSLESADVDDSSDTSFLADLTREVEEGPGGGESDSDSSDSDSEGSYVDVEGDGDAPLSYPLSSPLELDQNIYGEVEISSS